MEPILARIMELPIVILALIFGFVIVMNNTQTRSRERRERLRVLESAIKSGSLDAAMKQELLEAVTGRQGERARRQAPHRQLRYGWAFGLGWLAIFLGGALMMMGGSDQWEGGLISFSLGLGVITLPLALREIEQRGTERARG